MKCVPLTYHQIVAPKFNDCFEERSKPANQLLKAEYATTEAKTVIAKERQIHGTGNAQVTELIPVLESEEEFYLVLGDSGLFAAVYTAYNHHFKPRTSPDDYWWFCVRF